VVDDAALASFDRFNRSLAWTGTIVTQAGLSVVDTGIPHGPNRVWGTGATPADAAHILRWIRERPGTRFIWFVSEDDSLGHATLAAAGLRTASGASWMCMATPIDALRAHDVSSHRRAWRVESPADVERWSHLVATVYGSFTIDSYASWLRQRFSRERDEGIEWWIGGIANRVDTALALMPSENHIGVYWVATLSDSRGQGAASSLMVAAAQGTALLDQNVVLQSTPAGRRTYDRLGFRVTTQIGLYPVSNPHHGVR
jgi:hypothetical protein